MDRFEFAFLKELYALGSTLAELDAFCERTRNVHIKVKEGVALASAIFKRVKITGMHRQTISPLAPRNLVRLLDGSRVRTVHLLLSITNTVHMAEECTVVVAWT